jgi:hypothetical protein
MSVHSQVASVCDTLPVNTDPWGSEDEPISHSSPPLPAHIAALESVTEPRPVDMETFRRPEAEDLPELKELAAAGWVLLAWDQRMIWPVWPSDHRGWIPDRVPTFSTYRNLDGSTTLRPVTEWQERFARQDDARYWTPLNLPAPPRDRLWLVRSPWPARSVESLWAVISRRAFQMTPDDPFRSIKTAASELVTSDGALASDWERINVPNHLSWVQGSD